MKAAGASLIAQLVKNLPVMQEIALQEIVRFLGQKDPLEKGQATHSSILGLPFCPAGKESACKARDLGSIPGLGRSPGEGKGYPLYYSGWRIPWTVESMGSQRVGHKWVTFTFGSWEKVYISMERRKIKKTPRKYWIWIGDININLRLKISN